MADINLRAAAVQARDVEDTDLIFAADPTVADGTALKAATVAEMRGKLGTALSDTDPQALAATAAEGTSTEASRADHVHPTTGIPTLVTGGTPTTEGTATQGTANTASRSDHVHPKRTLTDSDIPASIARDSELPQPSTATPTNTPGSPKAGVATAYARGDHDHGVTPGAGGGGGEDNVQSDWDETDTTSDAYILNKPTIPTVPARAGAFTAADETKLDGIETGAQVNPTDAEIGDKAFSNPPSDLSTAEQTAVRSAIGAGTGSGGGGGASLSDTDPQALAATAAEGTATDASRSDHVHPTTGLAVLQTTGATRPPAATGSRGTGATASRSDHVHPQQTVPALADTTPGNTPGTASAGTSTSASRSDHDHGIATGGSAPPAAAPQALTPGTSTLQVGGATLGTEMGDNVSVDIPITALGSGTLASGLSSNNFTLKAGSYLIFVHMDEIWNTTNTNNSLQYRSIVALEITGTLPAGSIHDPMPHYFRGAVVGSPAEAAAQAYVHLPADTEIGLALVGYPGVGEDNSSNKNLNYHCTIDQVHIFPMGGIKGDKGDKGDAGSGSGGASAFSELTGQIAASQIPDDVIDGDMIDAGAVATEHIAAAAVINSKLAPNAVSSSKIASDQVETRHIQADAVTTAKVADGAITADKIASGVIPSNSGTTVSAHTPAAGDTELAGVDIDSTDYEIVDRQSRDRLHEVEQRVHPIREIPQTWADIADTSAGWVLSSALSPTLASLTYAQSAVTGTSAQFVYVRIPVGAVQSNYRFQYTITGGSENGEVHNRVLGTWSGEQVGSDTSWRYYRIAFYEGSGFSGGKLQVGGSDTFEWEGSLTSEAVEDQLDALGIPQQIGALKNVTRDLHLDGTTRLVKNSAAATAGVARVAVANSALQAIEAGTQNLDVQGVTFTATLANAHFGSTATTTDQPVIRLAQTEDRADWRILFDTATFLAGGWVPITVSNGSATHDYYISSKVDRTTEIALYKSTEETTYYGELRDGLAIPPVTTGGGAAVTGIWRGTQAQYDAITSKDANVVYLIESTS